MLPHVWIPEITASLTAGVMFGVGQLLVLNRNELIGRLMRIDALTHFIQAG
jgi:hypothetical protein